MSLTRKSWAGMCCGPAERGQGSASVDCRLAWDCANLADVRGYDVGIDPDDHGVVVRHDGVAMDANGGDAGKFANAGFDHCHR